MRQEDGAAGMSNFAGGPSRWASMALWLVLGLGVVATGCGGGGSTMALPSTTTTTVDPGTLPQTMTVPTTSDPQFRAGLAGFFQAIIKDDPTRAMPFFFPLSAYLQVKAISNPASDWLQRLVGAYQRDIHALHASLGAAAATAAANRDRRPGHRPVDPPRRRVQQGLLLAGLRLPSALHRGRPSSLLYHLVDDLLAGSLVHRPPGPDRLSPATTSVNEPNPGRAQPVCARSSASFSDGFRYSRVLRGRSLRLRAIRSRSCRL